MAISRKRWHLVAALLLIGAYLFLQHLASRPKTPDLTPEADQARQPFPLDFTLPDLQGQTVRLSDLHGQVVLLNFWASWCHPCRTEIPSMNALYQDYQRKGFTILAVATDIQGHDTVAPFAQDYALTFPVLLDPHNVVGTRLQVLGIPTSYLLDKQGRIAAIEMGAKDWNSARVRRLLDRLLAEEIQDTPALTGVQESRP
jgi:peroxiredoxin